MTTSPPKHCVAILVALSICSVLDVSSSTSTSAVQRGAYTMTAEVVNSTSVNLRWSPVPGEAADGNGANDDTTCPVRLFLIRLKQDASRRVRTWKVDGTRNSVSLHGLNSGTMYHVRIVAVACGGRSKPSKWITVRTAIETASRVQDEQRETVVPGQPQDVTTRTFADSVIVTWRPPDGGATVRGYVVGYGEGVPDVSWQYLEPHRRNVTIRNLKRDTQYVISVRAFNNVGKGPVLYDLVYTTDSQDTAVGTLPLAAPTNVHSKVLSSTTIWLQWTDPSLGRQQLVPDSRYYNVHYQAVQPLGKALSAVARDLHVILYNLSPATRYEFKVRTVKDAQTSHYSTVITNRTQETVPSSAPRDVKVALLGNSTNGTSVRVTWRHPRHSNGNITEYLVFYTWNEALPSEKWQVKQIIGPLTDATIVGLSPTATTYYFRVQARNSHGFGPKSDILKLTLNSAEATSTGQQQPPGVNGIGTTSTRPGLPSVGSSSTSSPISGIGEDGDDNTDSDGLEGGAESDVDDTHYDYVESLTDADPADDATNSTTSVSGSPAQQSSAAQNSGGKSKRVTSLLSPRDLGLQPAAAETGNDQSPTVTFRASLVHHVTAFITWPSATDDNACRSTSSRRQTAKANGVIGYQLRYRPTTSGEFISKYVTDNMVLLDGLLPNMRYEYQLRYVRRQGAEAGNKAADNDWSQVAEFNTGTV